MGILTIMSVWGPIKNPDGSRSYGSRGTSFLLPIVIIIGILSAITTSLFQGTPNDEHVLPLETQPEFLTEDLALELADKVLLREGLDPALWEPHPDGRSTAPDGSRDEYLSRNALNPNMASIMFMKSNDTERFVRLELREGEVVGNCVIAK